MILEFIEVHSARDTLAPLPHAQPPPARERKPAGDATGSSNTFQIRMFFDGRVVIAYRGLTATDGVAGLSGRTTAPTPFFPSNLSNLGVCAAPCPADVDGDGFITFNDLNVILGSFGQAGANLPGDVDRDGTVTFADLNLVLSVFGTSC